MSSRILLTSDLHLGHKNIHKYRTEFSTAEEHHEAVWDNLVSNITKRDSIIFLGDIAFTHEWLLRIENLNCVKKTLIVGNHDTERGINMRHIVNAYDEVHSLLSYRGYWLSHCPIHPQEIRGRKGNIHGHLHGNQVWVDQNSPEYGGYDELDTRFINVCLEHTDYKPITWQEATQ